MELTDIKDFIKRERKKMEKGQRLAEIEGFANLQDLCQEFIMDSVIPGICMSPYCDYSIGVEPDSSSGWCEECRDNTVASAFVIMGII